jgi:hypothetical protein
VARRELAVALTACLVAGACESSKSKLDEPAAKAGSSAAPASGSAAASAALTACPDSVLQPRLEAALAASKRYFDALQTHSATWSTDCEAVRVDLLTLESEGDLFMQAMTSMKTWGKTLSAECRARIETLGEANPITEQLESRSPALEARVKPVLERCNDHPGFRDAAKKALRLMKKKQQR